MNTYSVLIFALYILVTQWQKINSEDRGKKNSSVKIDRRFNQSADEIFDRNNSLTRFKKDAIMHRSNKAARSLTEPLEYNKSNMQISSKHRLQKRFSNPYLSLGQILNAIQDFHNKRKHLTLQNTITEEELVLEPPPGPALVPDEESEIESEPVRESAPQPTEETIPESNEEPASQTIPEDEPVQEEEEDDEEEDEDEDEEEEYEEEEDEEDPTQGEEEEALQEEEDVVEEEEEALQKEEEAVQEEEEALQEKEVALQEGEEALQEGEEALQEKEEILQEVEEALQEEEELEEDDEEPIKKHEQESLLKQTPKAVQELSLKLEQTSDTSTTQAPASTPPIQPVVPTPPLAPKHVVTNVVAVSIAKKSHQNALTGTDSPNKNQDRIEIKKDTAIRNNILEKLIAQVKNDKSENKIKKARVFNLKLKPKKRKRKKKFHIRLIYRLHKKKT